MYNTIEDLICDDNVPALIRVKALNRYEEVYNGCFNISQLANSFGRITNELEKRAKSFGMIGANSIVSYYK